MGDGIEGWNVGRKAKFEGMLKGGMATKCSGNFLKIHEGNPDEVSKKKNEGDRVPVGHLLSARPDITQKERP